MFAFSKVVFEDLVGDHTDINADFVDPIILSCSRDDPLMELVNNLLRDQPFLGIEDKLNGGVVLRNANIAIEQFYFFPEVWILFGQLELLDASCFKGGKLGVNVLANAEVLE